jgi:3-hydroxybutyryl-CoA dehydrogenase
LIGLAPDIAVIGAGTMGAGIAQLALEHGHAVRLLDVDAAATQRASDAIRERLSRRLARQGLSGAQFEATLATMLGRLDLGSGPDDAAGADVVIEAIVEDLATKQTLFARLDDVCRADTILATNTSALSIGAIAAAARAHPERVVGLHFFNPAPVMRLVEVVAGAATALAVVEAAAGLVEGWKRSPIRCADRPGFVVNRVNRPFTIQALRAIEAGESTISAIDAAIRDLGFPLGPFELMDLAGIDVNLAAATGVWEGFDRAPRFRPSPIQAALVARGRLGRKSGEGFYRYAADGVRLGPGAEFDAPTTGPAATGTAAAAATAERIRLAIANEAFKALDERLVGDEATIDLALTLGASHPEGPFAWARGRSLPAVVAGLEALAPTEPDAFMPADGLRAAVAEASRAGNRPAIDLRSA